MEAVNLLLSELAEELRYEQMLADTDELYDYLILVDYFFPYD